MPIKIVTSPANPLFRRLSALAENRKTRKETGQTLLDGEHLLTEAMQAGLVPVHLLISESFQGIGPWQDRLPQTPVTRLPDALFKRLSPVSTPTGILSLIGIPVESVPDAPDFAVLLEDIQEPGNLGALLRTAAAAGVQVAYLSKGCTDAWSPKALRGGQGGHFGLHIVEGVDLGETARSFKGSVYAAVLRSEQSLYDLPMREPTAFLFGNEGTGLSESVLRSARPFSIPMPGQVESLNVTAAAAVCLFERARQCGVGTG